ncbi:hypothetical protein MAR_003822 [Mya arenaria]|uniref:Uncharacterized protein n=1 Tax=Mya arenaria TaxID=6604 RepID=A0ABY7EUT6_MYAAR|nr:hypothetical protein MAR_003822 [Mya arenaria]
MLPFMAASGHNLYTKSARIYVQQMCKLQVEHPYVYQRFEEGYHVVRRIDLIIEQVLMRSMKTSGGFTRGRGVNCNTGEQNKDMTDARQARDIEDTQIVLNYLLEINPFCLDASLRSVSTGVHAHITVNVDKAKTIGNTILARMDGQTIAEFSFKKKDQAIILNPQSSVKIGGEPHKPVLADAIWDLLTPDLPGITGQVQLYTEYVTRKYGEASVVFDGYEGTSTKNMAHQRRGGGRTGATVTFDEEMPVTMKKEEFLANSTN